MFLLILVFAMMSGAGCFDRPLPAADRERAGRLLTKLKESGDKLAGEVAATEALKRVPDAVALAPVIEREDWADQLLYARGHLDRARELEPQLLALLKEDNRNKLNALQSSMESLARFLKLADEAIGSAAHRRTLLETVRRDIPAWEARTEQELIKLEALIEALRPVLEKAAADYPHKRIDLAARLGQLEQRREAARAGLERVSRQRERAGEGKTPRYLALIEGGVAADQAEDEGRELDAEYRRRVSELSQRRSRTLVDMRVLTHVRVGRTSWDESSNSNTEKEFIYGAHTVDRETAERLEPYEARDEVIAVGCHGCRRPFRFTIDPRLGEALDLDPRLELPPRHDDAEFWVAEVSARYFHRYLDLQEERFVETDWIEVDEALFEKQEEFLGMEIEAKPRGLYADEAVTVAAPPGLAWVGLPDGGSWTTAEDGARVWVHAAMLAPVVGLLGGYRFTESEWRTWVAAYRGRKPYFGADGDRRALFGTYGVKTRTHPKLAASNFLKTGGARGTDGSVRTAGSAARAGGPGGGGK